MRLNLSIKERSGPPCKRTLPPGALSNEASGRLDDELPADTEEVGRLGGEKSAVLHPDRQPCRQRGLGDFAGDR